MADFTERIAWEAVCDYFQRGIDEDGCNADAGMHALIVAAIESATEKHVRDADGAIVALAILARRHADCMNITHQRADDRQTPTQVMAWALAEAAKEAR